MQLIALLDSQHDASMGWAAHLALDFTREGDRTRMLRGRQYGPLTTKKALYPEGSDCCHAVILHPPGGVVQGDSLRLELALHERAAALLTTPGATKWYRAARPAGWALAATVAPGALLEYLPQENIAFDGAHAGLQNRFDLQGDGTLMALDITALGRAAAAERFAKGTWQQASEIRRDGALLWWERTVLQGDDPLLRSAAGLGGAAVFGTLVIAATALQRLHLDGARSVAAAPAQGAVTLLPGVLVARALGGNVEPVRNYLVGIWQALRPALTGRAATLPRIWRT